MSNYTITLNETQLRAVNAALEEYFRLRLGQFWSLADDLASIGVDMSRDNPNHKAIFDHFISRRDAGRIAFDAAYRICNDSPSSNTGEIVGEDGLICEDIWKIIQHQLWKDDYAKNDYTVDSQEPYLMSDQPPIKIEVSERD